MALSEDSEIPSSSDNEGSGSDVDVPLVMVDGDGVVVDVLEPLAGSSTDVPPPAVVVDALEHLDDDGVEKVLGLLKRAKARKRLDPAVEFLRERVGQCLPSLGGMVLSSEAFEEALNQMSTEAG